MEPNSFNRLLDLHSEIDAIFFAHQCAILRFDFINALALLDSYKTQLQKHMLDEEDILLPIYSERKRATGAGAPQIFLDDHIKMRSFIDLFEKRTAELASTIHPELELIQLLDREAFYKRLCSHHDKRERDFLYPVLDEVTTEVERAEVMGRVTAVVDNYL